MQKTSKRRRYHLLPFSQTAVTQDKKSPLRLNMSTMRKSFENLNIQEPMYEVTSSLNEGITKTTSLEPHNKGLNRKSPNSTNPPIPQLGKEPTTSNVLTRQEEGSHTQAKRPTLGNSSNEAGEDFLPTPAPRRSLQKVRKVSLTAQSL